MFARSVWPASRNTPVFWNILLQQLIGMPLGKNNNANPLKVWYNKGDLFSLIRIRRNFSRKES